MAESVVFKWNPDEFQESLDNCPKDDGIKLALSFLPDKSWKILEAGCGNGRVVKYLHHLGYRRICGIEVSQETVQWINNHSPELQITAADILQMPFEKESFDAILSFGVIEHFPAGPKAPLAALRNALKENGLAVITVPSYNILRKIKNKWRNKEPRDGQDGLFHVFPSRGPFFEYRFTPKEFVTACRESGFHILRSIPIAHADGLYHEIGRPWIDFKNGKFKYRLPGLLLNAAFSKIPFFHNHMHACVLLKKTAT
ncbi:MAG: class I SAM-dependent methyltransferase [Fibrobacterota bacterium]